MSGYQLQLNQLKGSFENAKEQAQKAEKIAFLFNIVDFKEGGEVAENLNCLYNILDLQLKFI